MQRTDAGILEAASITVVGGDVRVLMHNETRGYDQVHLE